MRKLNRRHCGSFPRSEPGLEPGHVSSSISVLFLLTLTAQREIGLPQRGTMLIEGSNDQSSFVQSLPLQDSRTSTEEKRESESRSVRSDSLRPHGLYSSWNSLGQNTGVGSLSLLQGIFPTQGWNPGLPHCRRILYQLNHKGSPRILEWVVYPFSSRSSHEPGSPALQMDSSPTELTEEEACYKLACKFQDMMMWVVSHGLKASTNILVGYIIWRTRLKMGLRLREQWIKRLI